MLVLGIETSCDETAAAIVDGDGKVRAHAILSQVAEHRPFGGIVPEIAARSHLAHLDSLIAKAMTEAGIGYGDLGAVAVTAGPGLIGGVIVGVMTAKSISAVHKIPFVAVNHLEGHALTARFTDQVSFPYLLLLVSGGHTQLVDVGGIGRYRILGDTLERISYMLGIFKALNILLPDEDAADRWIKKPNEAPIFGGKPALRRMLSGHVSDLFVVRQFLDSQRGGWA